jgi:hypothetical protein
LSELISGGEKTMEKQIFITTDGGLIQDINVSTDLEDVEITIVDFDIEGSMMDIKKTPLDEDALIYEELANIISSENIEFWEEILARRDK